MRWPWQSKAGTGVLAIGSAADALTWVSCDTRGKPGRLRCGVEPLTGTDAAEAGRRLRELGLPPDPVVAVLSLQDCQLLQIDAPAVQPDELKAAARWHIKDLIDGRLDDMTIDVMVVGDDKPRPQRHLFVAAARNAVVRAVAERSQAAGMALSVIDIRENAQRNLQSALARAQGLEARATAALMVHGTQCLLTICAGGELYFARRIDWDDLVASHGADAAPAPATMASDLENMDFIDYGAMNDSGPAAAVDETPRLVIELQRSLDVWERSWPDLPLARLWVQVGEMSAALVAMLATTLATRVEVFEPEQVFPGFDAAATTPALRAAVLPLLGALLRSESRQL
ncbi:MAG: hypothetical protein Q8N44_04735 [Rubrivivax sp.]|nr:hypothetical protein [Rubrivivax sp.]